MDFVTQSCLGFLLVAARVSAGALELALLHVNDHHSHLNDDKFAITSNIPQLSVSTSKVEVRYGGYERLVTLVKDLKTANEAASRGVLKLHAGDAITGTSYYSLFKGEPDAHMMSLVCYDAFALGNHEFDDGDTTLAAFIDMLHSYDSHCPDTPVVAANVNPGSSSPLVGKLQNSTTKTINGEKVGIVGIDVKLKTEQASSPDHGTTLSDEKTAAQAEIDKLLAAGVDKIILLTHIGFDKDQAWMTTLTGVDVVVGGDSHSLLGGSNTIVGNPVGTYPKMATNADGEKMCIVQAWEYAHGVGEVKVSFDANGVVTSCTGSMKYPFDSSSSYDDTNKAALGSADQTKISDYLTGLGTFMAVAKDTGAVNALTTYANRIDTLKATKIADVPSNICFERIPGQGRSTICNVDASKAQGGAVCNLVAKAFMTQTATADVAIQNGGGCRTDIAKGDFTYDDAYSLLPFSNMLVTLVLTGAQIKSLLEDALDFSLTGSSGAYPYASGLRYAVNMNATKGNRVSGIEINSRLGGSFASISSTESYTIVTNDYIATGKDGYATFTTSSISQSWHNTYTEYAQGFIDYAQTVATLVAPPLSEFSTTCFTAEDGTVHSACQAIDGATDVSGSVRIVPVLVALALPALVAAFLF